DGSHFQSPFSFPSPHHAASMAIVRPKATAAASLATAAKRRMAQARVSWLREEWASPRGRNAQRAIAA
ncbi:hypothetical protein LB526_18655, partial [Mesorhizobium sp. CA6]|uniref:hypothetical protein n=1 Tax=Mesorhizobium sp. CA6 TaxID=588500 RepID=UPI001CC9B687